MSRGRFLPTYLLSCSPINMPVICTAWKSKGNENFAGNQDAIYDWLWGVKFWNYEILYKIFYLIYYYYYYLYYIYILLYGEIKKFGKSSLWTSLRHFLKIVHLGNQVIVCVTAIFVHIFFIWKSLKLNNRLILIF